MAAATTPVFALPDRLAAKADPALTDADERHFTVLARALDAAVAAAGAELASALREAGRGGQGALERDQRIHRLTTRLRVLRRFGVDACLGRTTGVDGTTTYIGRFGLGGATEGERLLVDWRTPAAEPFFAATAVDARGLASRRRYRWSDGRVVDYWDEVFDDDRVADGSGATLDDRSAFVASLGSARTARMRDVLATIAADQDAAVRADSRGTLVVDGGPGTGKTVVALHRAAYLLHADPRLRDGRGRVLVIGPSRPYLDYVADVLPGLGEESVRLCTLTDLVPEGAVADAEPDAEVARLKASGRLVTGIEAAVALYEEPPTRGLEVPTGAASLRITPGDWREAFAAAAGTAHNEARPVIVDELVALLRDRYEDQWDDQAERAVRTDRGMLGELERSWPVVPAADLVGDLWSVPAYLRRCAPYLSRDQVALLQRDDPQAWTTSDLPLLDAARRRLGDPDADRKRRALDRETAQRRARFDDVVADLVRSDDSELMVMSMLRRDDLADALVDDGRGPDVDSLAGPFAHVVVDEAQELTDAEWQMVLGRCPSRSLTVVGDRAQARHGFTQTWEQRLAAVGVLAVRTASLTVNYRTPAEVMAVAEPVIRAVLPDANVPTSVRRSGVPVRHGRADERDAVLAAWETGHAAGIACVIGDPEFEPRPRVRSLTPELAKGLEFDLVVLVRPDRFGRGVTGAVDRYVAMTRATGELVVLA
ncbi:RNA polymerase recycling motor ATPase HelR [Jatrophihabitans fulvus]